MTSLEKRRAMSESRVLDISALLEPLRRDAVAGGSFGDVFQYRHRDGRLCAVKSLRPHAINVEDPHALTKVGVQISIFLLFPQGESLGNISRSSTLA